MKKTINTLAGIFTAANRLRRLAPSCKHLRSVGGVLIGSGRARAFTPEVLLEFPLEYAGNTMAFDNEAVEKACLSISKLKASSVCLSDEGDGAGLVVKSAGGAVILHRPTPDLKEDDFIQATAGLDEIGTETHPAEDFMGALARVKPYMSRDQSRAVIMSVLLERCQSGTLRAVATDGNRLCICAVGPAGPAAPHEDPPSCQALLTPEGLAILENLHSLGLLDGQVDLEFLGSLASPVGNDAEPEVESEPVGQIDACRQAGYLRVKAKGVTALCRLREGQYPVYRGIVPRHRVTAEVFRSDFQKAVAEVVALHKSVEELEAGVGLVFCQRKLKFIPGATSDRPDIQASVPDVCLRGETGFDGPQASVIDHRFLEDLDTESGLVLQLLLPVQGTGVFLEGCLGFRARSAPACDLTVLMPLRTVGGYQNLVGKGAPQSRSGFHSARDRVSLYLAQNPGSEEASKYAASCLAEIDEAIGRELEDLKLEINSQREKDGNAELLAGLEARAGELEALLSVDARQDEVAAPPLAAAA